MRSLVVASALPICDAMQELDWIGKHEHEFRVASETAKATIDEVTKGSWTGLSNECLA